MRESVIGIQPRPGCTPLAAPSQFSQYPCRTLPDGRGLTAQLGGGPVPVGVGVGVGDGVPVGVGVGDGVPPLGVHRWLLLPGVLHDHSSTIVPFAVPLPKTSTHLPDGTPVIVRLLFIFHFWLLAPLHVAVTSFVPLPVPPPAAARHRVALPVVTRSSLAAVDVQAWLAPPVQVWITTWVALASRHLPDLGLTSALPVMAASAPGTNTRAAVAATAAAPAAPRAWTSRIRMASIVIDNSRYCQHS